MHLCSRLQQRQCSVSSAVSAVQCQQCSVSSAVQCSVSYNSDFAKAKFK